jgi:ubiquinone biosynthesis protein UbiJ
MDALERLLRPLAGMINRQIRSKTPARELCEQLDGKVVAVRVRDTALAMYFVVKRDALELKFSAPDADVSITGSLFALAGLAARTSESRLRDGSIDLAGDMYTAQAFQQLLAYGQPDIEEELSGIIGDVAARSLSDAARQIGRWTLDAGSTMQQNITEYLQEESGALPSHYELDNFRERVNVLRDDVDRLEARIRRFERLRQ